MPRFNVKNNRNDDGTYTLSYGKGKKKLIATMTKGDDGWWYAGENCPPSSPFTTMKDCKAAWGEWAKKNYGSDEAESPRPQAGQPSDPKPAPPRRPGPPTRSGPPRRQPPTRSTPPKRTPPTRNSPPPQHDPFDPALEYPGDHPEESLRRTATPLGALDQVYSWMIRNSGRVKHPTDGTLAPPWDTVQAVLQRHRPNSDRYSTFKGTTDVAAAAPPKRKLDRQAFDTARGVKPLGENDYDPLEDDIPF